MTPPIEDLLFRIVQIEEGFHGPSVPSYKRREGSGEGKHAFGAARLNRRPAEALLNVGNLNGINVDSHYSVMSGECDGGAASRGDAKDASARLKRTKLNCGVLIHAPEQ